MPTRATKRGVDRTPLEGSHDVLICGASFAGLAAARELAGSGADVLVIDRYEIGERQTSACAIPTDWLRVLGGAEAARQEFDTLAIHTPHGTSRYRLPWRFSTFDYRQLCHLVWEQCDATFETAKVHGRADPAPVSESSTAGADLISVETDRGVISAPLVLDALGWRRMLDEHGDGYQPPDAPLSRGLEVHPSAPAEDMELELWIDRRYVPAGYGWSFPAGDEVRIGVGSFDPAFHVKEPTVLLTDDLSQEPAGYQGNWIPHELRDATGGGVFFAGDSAGHCLPLTAEGIRTALYFGVACGRELRAVIDQGKTRDQALAAYGEFSAGHEWKFRWLLRAQKVLPRFPAQIQRMLVRLAGSQRFVDWSFRHYLRVAPPEFAERAPKPAREKPGIAAAA